MVVFFQDYEIMRMSVMMDEWILLYRLIVVPSFPQGFHFPGNI